VRLHKVLVFIGSKIRIYKLDWDQVEYAFLSLTREIAATDETMAHNHVGSQPRWLMATFDRLVYEFFALTQDEIRIVEEK
jgi:hypothetical protein